jgi:uncharacterized membrane protein YdjX (TVP38/TMEM64 family)
MARWVRPGLLVLLAAAGVVVALTVDLPQLGEIRAWVRGAGWAAPVLYALAFALVSLTPAPATVLTVGAGALFGWVVGVPVALLGALGGAYGGFGLARLLGRATVQGLVGERLDRLDGALRRRGMLAVIIVRLVPTGPFAMVNTACGLSAVRARDYVLGTAIGMVPGIGCFVAVGAFGATPWSMPFLMAVLGLAALVAGGALLGRRRFAGDRPIRAGRRSAGPTAETDPIDAPVDAEGLDRSG